MPISISCNACGYQFKVKDDFAGRKGKCPQCSDIFQAPSGKTSGTAKKPARNPSAKPAQKKSPSAQPRKKVAAAAKSSSTAKKRKVPQVTAVGKPAPKAVKVDAVSLPTGQAVASRPTASTASTYRRRRRSAPPVWIWLILGGGGTAAIVGWVMFATGNLSPKDKQVAEKAPQRQTASEKSSGAEDREATKKEKESSKSSTEEEESESSEKEKVPDPDEEKKPEGETEDSTKQTPESSAPEKPAEPETSSVTGEQITTLAEACRQFQWQPKSKDNYTQLAECALGMNQAMGEAGTDAAAKVAGDILQELADMKWNANDIRAINRFAAERINDVGAGAFILVEVKSGKNGKAMAQLIETGELVMVEYANNQASPTPGAKWLILGVISPKETKVSFDPEGKVSQTLRNVEQMFLATITIATKADPFARDP